MSVKKLLLLLTPMLVLLVASASASASTTGFGWAEHGLTDAESALSVRILNQDGTPDTQAGSHPYEFASQVALNTEHAPGATDLQAAGGDVRDIEVELPPGLVGNPNATPQCSLELFREKRCPAETQVGISEEEFGGPIESPQIYNLVPPRGAPAEFGFILGSIAHVPIVMIPHVRTGQDYGVTALLSNLPQGFSLTRGKLTFWGVPADPGHNRYRGACWEGESNQPTALPASDCAYTGVSRPFLSLPTSCSGPLRFAGAIDSWHAPGATEADGDADLADPDWKTATTEIPGITGCDKLQFNPGLSVAPEPPDAASPTGQSVEITVPQTYENPAGLSESALRDTVVTLPAGVAVNPAAAAGLQACGEAEFGLHTAAEQTCPDASKLGTVTIATPLLQHPLEGAVYLAQQGNLPGNGSNPFFSLLALYLAVRDPYSGVLVKLAGEVHPDPVTGQLTTTFSENPQVPFNTLRLSFFGGPRAALVNPPVCGSYTATSEFSPWSGGAAASPSSLLQIVAGPSGSPCLASQPFGPQLVSGTLSNQAGAYSPYSLTFFRGDGEQNMSRIQVATPPGLVGALTGIPLCGEPQAGQGGCGQESRIGHVTVAVGAGSNPLYVTGQVFLTGPYNGAPFGLSIVVPAIAGPFNLGTEVVRAAVNVDPSTAALTVTSEPLPQILQGIPLLVRAVNVSIDREHFIFNPTDCNPLSVGATLTSVLGVSVADSSRFQVTNCSALQFKPQFKVTTSGKTSKADGASLDAKLVYPDVGGHALFASGQANIASVKVDLPRQLPSRLTTLQKACLAKQFEANPAGCPAASVIGIAKATTPLLPATLTGPAYFVSHGGEAFPSLEIVLQGYGVRVDLVGTTFISRQGITSSTFKTVPDVPVGTFELYLPAGPYSALAANGNLCSSSLSMPTAFLAQNGAEIHESTKIAVSGCPKPKPKAARKAKKARKSSHANGRKS